MNSTDPNSRRQLGGNDDFDDPVTEYLLPIFPDYVLQRKIYEIIFSRFVRFIYSLINAYFSYLFLL